MVARYQFTRLVALAIGLIGPDARGLLAAPTAADTAPVAGTTSKEAAGGQFLLAYRRDDAPPASKAAAPTSKAAAPVSKAAAPVSPQALALLQPQTPRPQSLAQSPVQSPAQSATSAIGKPLGRERSAATNPPPRAERAAGPSRSPVSTSTRSPRQLTRHDMSVSSPSGATRFSLADRLPLDAPTRQALTTALTGLAVVVGLLLVCTWLLKRSGPTAAGLLPPEAFAVLGRAQLADRSTIVLFRLGSKLVLAATTAEGLRPLTEVTDPTEVDRLAGLCSQGRLHGPAAEFQQVLQQLAREPARGFLDGQTQRGRA